jgi:AraC-like DNA-binding protein
MFDVSPLGVVYTEHLDLKATTPVASLWSFDTCVRAADRRAVALNRDGNPEYWLERSDPLLNTILPGTGVSLVVNFGDSWAAGRSLVRSALLPRVCVIGPVTQSRILRLSARVQAIGAVIPPALTMHAFGVAPSELVDRIVPLEDLWPSCEVEDLIDAISPLAVRRQVAGLRDAVVARLEREHERDSLADATSQLIVRRRGQISIDDIAQRHGVSRKQMARRFSAATGMTPKLFARVTRFQALVQALLSSDVSHWVSVAPSLGFYDQAHMINEFRGFAGAPPTVFFQPHGDGVDVETRQPRGRPSEWPRRASNPRPSDK